MSSERNEAVQAVLDRVTSYQDSATDGTQENELKDALTETGVDLSDDEVTALVTAVENADGPVSAESVLGS